WGPDCLAPLLPVIQRNKFIFEFKDEVLQRLLAVFRFNQSLSVSLRQKFLLVALEIFESLGENNFLEILNLNTLRSCHFTLGKIPDHIGCNWCDTLSIGEECEESFSRHFQSTIPDFPFIEEDVPVKDPIRIDEGCPVSECLDKCFINPEHDRLKERVPERDKFCLGIFECNFFVKNDMWIPFQ